MSQPTQPAAPLQPAMAAATVKDSTQKPPCRFTLFVRVSDDNPFRFKYVKPGEDDRCFTFRGDMYGATDPVKMLKTLLGIVKSKYRMYKLMELKDNIKPTDSGECLILKMLNNEVKRNLLLEYIPMLHNYHLPDKFCYEIKD
jgi:hypothetical protein